MRRAAGRAAGRAAHARDATTLPEDPWLHLRVSLRVSGSGAHVGRLLGALPGVRQRLDVRKYMHTSVYSGAETNQRKQQGAGGGDAEGSAGQRDETSELTVWKGTGRVTREDYLRLLERTGEMKRGSAGLPDDFWDLPRPEDPDASVRLAVREDRR